MYVIRDALDVIVTFYHHLSNRTVKDGGYVGTFDESFEDVIDGTTVYGKWHDHIESRLGG